MTPGSAMLTTLFVATTALLQTAGRDDHLDAGIELYWNGEYEATIERLSLPCARGTDVGDRVECLKYLALSHIALGDEEAAQSAFRGLLAADPAYRLDTSLVSPKVVRRYESASKALSGEWFDSGKEIYHREDYRDAVAQMERVLLLDPEHALAREYASLARERLRLEIELAGETGRPDPETEATTLADTPSASAVADTDRPARIIPAASNPVGAEPPPGEDERVYRLTSDIQAPVLRSKVDPVYPRADRLRRHQGTVVLSVVINHEGRVSEARVIRSVSDGIDRAAVEAVTRWRYEPATRGGHPVNVYGVVQLSFLLEH